MTGVKDPVAHAREIQKVGVNLVLYHRSLDEETTQGAQWDDQARQAVQELCELGLDVAVAGGINLNILEQLPTAPLYGMVIGRGISAQPDPAAAAQAIAMRVREIWG
jgi:3-dehydro-L-gulonate-6-phosphate decarboxylase